MGLQSHIPFSQYPGHAWRATHPPYPIAGGTQALRIAPTVPASLTPPIYMHVLLHSAKGATHQATAHSTPPIYMRVLLHSDRHEIVWETKGYKNVRREGCACEPTRQG